MRTSMRSIGLAVLTVLGLWVPALEAATESARIAVTDGFAAVAAELIPRFERATGHRIDVVAGPTDRLYAEIRDGAPFDLLLADDRERPERLEAEGHAIPGTRFTYAAGALGPQDAVLLDRAEDNSAARDFLAYLRRDDVREVIAAHGFDVTTPEREPGARLAFAEARVRQPIPGQDRTVAYFTVTNEGGRPVSLVAARADGVGAIEIHTTVRDGDMVRMRRLREVSVAPGETVVFEPGGRHLMLFRVTELPETLVIELETADGETLAVSFRRFALGL